MLIDPETHKVRAGGKAVCRLLCDRNASWRPVDAARRTYEIVGDSFGQVVHGPTPANVDGTFLLAEGARPRLEPLQRECSLAACASDTDTHRHTE